MTERQRISQQWNSSEVTRIAGELLSTSKNGGAGEKNGNEMTGKAAEGPCMEQKSEGKARYCSTAAEQGDTSSSYGEA